MTAAGGVVLAARGVSKQYPGTLALNGVEFAVRAGEVHALVGENGAGKSTLMRILAGIEPLTAGHLEMDGEPIELASTRAATARGIAMIHQELNLLPNLSVTDNLFLGRERTRYGVVERAAEEREAAALLGRMAQRVDVRTLCGDLPLGQQQAIEIARAVAQDARVVIMDEPTSALSAAEVAVLFRVIRNLKARGVAVIYISHHLEELLEIGDRVTVLRDGRVVAEALTAGLGVNWIVEKMTGGAAGAGGSVAKAGKALFAARGISLGGELHGVSFEVAAGEIVGFYGLLGAGRTPLFESLIGLRAPERGEMRLDGRELSGLSIAERIAAGVALLPESRQRDAIVPDLSVRENIVLANRSGCYCSPAEERRKAAELVRELHIRTADLESPITSLSGGNQQKVVLARYLLTSPKLLLLDEPTCGVDIGARGEIYEILRRLAARGIAILFASSELQEVMTLATRVIVMASGRVAGEFTGAGMTEEALVAASSPLGLPGSGGASAYV